jgi:hypothetical protein
MTSQPNDERRWIVSTEKRQADAGRGGHLSWVTATGATLAPALERLEATQAFAPHYGDSTPEPLATDTPLRGSRVPLPRCSPSAHFIPGGTPEHVT